MKFHLHAGCVAFKGRATATAKQGISCKDGVTALIKARNAKQHTASGMAGHGGHVH